MRYSASNNGVTLKCGFVQGHWRRYHSKAQARFPMRIPQVSVALYCIISEIKWQRDIGRKSRLFHAIAHPHSMPPLEGFRRNIVISFGTETLKWNGCRRWKSLRISLLVSTQYRRSWWTPDGRTDRQKFPPGRHRPRLCRHRVALTQGVLRISNLVPRPTAGAATWRI